MLELKDLSLAVLMVMLVLVTLRSLFPFETHRYAIVP